MPHRLPLVLITLLLTSLLAAPPCSLRSVAAAQVAAPETTEANSRAYAKAIEQAVRAFNEGRFVEARTHFGQAHALWPSARTWRGLGSTDFELGHYEEAVQELSQALRDPRGALSPALRTQTEQTLEFARARLPPAVEPAPVVLPPSEPAQQPEPQAASEPAVPKPASGPSAVWLGPTQPVSQRDDTQAAARRFGLLRGLALGSAVVSLTGFALATGYGLRSMHQGDTRDQYCSHGLCDDERGVHAGRAALRDGNIATAGFVIGGVGLASALVLWWYDLRHDEPRDTRARLLLGPRSVAVQGSL
jgi:hypothetical protein